MKEQTRIMENLSTPYTPVALYLEESDSLEYVKADGPCVYKRVDPLLTLVLDMRTRKLIGFRIKGFKNFYLKSLKDNHTLLRSEFLLAASVLERAMELAARRFFDTHDERKASAYREAWKLAADDKVELRDLPLAA
jgi:hypothetical protein